MTPARHRTEQVLDTLMMVGVALLLWSVIALLS
jgi:hypothetical protein